MGSRNSSTSPLNKFVPPRKFQPSALKVGLRLEQQEDEIKKYAETAMNELLSWYGYEKVDSADTQGLKLHHFDVRPPAALMANQKRVKLQLEGSQRRFALSRRRQKSPTSDSTDSEDEVELQVDTNVPSTPRDQSNSEFAVCSWCHQVGAHIFNPMSTSDDSKEQKRAFCSEQCFSQCRRANFKRNKVCDWCKHVRHTMNYVDYQDSETQLQFCSEKCLNQCKMSIFCKEAQAHLQTHLVGSNHQPSTSSSSGGTLITPDLWLKDCKNSDDDGSGLAGAGSASPKSTISSHSNQSASPSPKIEPPTASKPPSPVKQKQVSGRDKKGKDEDRRPLNCPLPTLSAEPPPLPQPPPNFLPPEHLRIPPLRPFFPHTFMPPPMDMGMMQVPPFRSPMMPPVTIMVPFPVPLPIPIPIPIVLPLFGLPKMPDQTPAEPAESKKDDAKEKEPPEQEARTSRKKRKIA